MLITTPPLSSGMWISPELKIYLIKEFQRLKEDENRRLSLAWNLNRTLAKINYRIHTDAIRTHLIPAEVTAQQAAIAIRQMRTLTTRNLKQLERGKK